jgi:hypothetical protein
MKMEPIEGSETSAISTQTPGKHPKENILQAVICFLLLRFRGEKKANKVRVGSFVNQLLLQVHLHRI